MIENIRECIQDDNTILHPQAQVIDDPQKFVREILNKEIIDKLDFSGSALQKDSQQFQMEYFEDFFIQGKDKFTLQVQPQPKRKSRTYMHQQDAISEDLNAKKDQISDIFGLKEPKERSGSSETQQRQNVPEICSNHEQELAHGQAVVGLSISSAKCEDNLQGFSVKKEIEPEDNIERDDDQWSSGSDMDYDTELDTDELIGNTFQHSNNTSFEAQEKMLGGSLTRESRNNSRQSGGIKCLRDFRKTRPKLKPASRKKKKGVLKNPGPKVAEEYLEVILTN